MPELDVLLKNQTVRFEQLLPFGFAADGEGYVYSAALVDGQLEMIVTITKEGAVATKVIDPSSGENYVLHHISDATGAFVGAVRTDYASVLMAIIKACFVRDVFKSETARHVIHYVREKYQDELQFLWTKFSDNAVYRRKDNAKWYAVLLIIKRNKLGFNDDGIVDILDLRGQPDTIERLIDGKRYLPGYHMNKKHWFTICLDGSVPVEEIFCRIDESYALTARKTSHR